MTSVPMTNGTFPLRLIGCNQQGGSENSETNSDVSANSSQAGQITPEAQSTNVHVSRLMKSDRRLTDDVSEATFLDGESRSGHPPVADGSPKPATVTGPYHRVKEVRVQQGVSIRSMARRMGIDTKTYKRLENPSTDLCLSELAAIRRALEVPFSDLLVEQQGLARPVEERAKMVKVMKTAVALRESKSNPRVQRLAQMLCEQIESVMPELAEVSGWPQFGARRGKNVLGRVLSQPIDMSQLSDS